jgi:hypothetical protein
MRWSAVAVPLIVVTSLGFPAGASVAAEDAQPGEEEQRAPCADELEILERRQRVFEAQGLSRAEIARRNESQAQDLAACRRQIEDQQRRAREDQQDLEEAARRAGPGATEKEREQAWRERRRERLASRSPASLTDAERAELAAGMEEEVAATHEALDAANARDPSFMRVVHSALACYHGDRKVDLENLVASEQALVRLGGGSKQKLYALRSELRASEAILDRSREEQRRLGPLERCSAPTVALVAHCLGVRLQGRPSEPACEAEQINQYVRFVK